MQEIDARRRALNLSVARLVELAGLSEMTYSRWLNDPEGFRFRTYRRLIEALKGEEERMLRHLEALRNKT